MASLFVSILDVLGNIPLTETDFLTLAVHCCFLSKGFTVQPSSATEANPSNDSQKPGKSAVSMVRRLEDGSVATVILPSYWRLSNSENQGFAISYSHHSLIYEPSKGPRELQLKAVVLGNHLTFLLSDSYFPNELATLNLLISDFVAAKVSQQLKLLGRSATSTSEKAQWDYEEIETIFTRLMPEVVNVLIKKFLKEDKETEDTESDVSEAPSKDETVGRRYIVEPRSNYFVPYMQPSPAVPDILQEMDDTRVFPGLPERLEMERMVPDGELVGPSHAIFRHRPLIGTRERRMHPAARFDPVYPFNTPGSPNPDHMRRSPHLPGDGNDSFYI